MALPVFLTIQAGDYVIISESYVSQCSEWWLGQVLFVQGGARSSDHPTLFQVVNIDTDVIHWINADCVVNKLSTCDI